MKRWKFLRCGMRSASGNCVWKLREWKHEKRLKLCYSGFHCSKKLLHAFCVVSGEILALVEVRGKSVVDSTKEAWSDMRVLRAWAWGPKDSVELAVYAAEQCIDTFEGRFPADKRPRAALEAAKEWLRKPDSAISIITEAAVAATNAAVVALAVGSTAAHASSHAAHAVRAACDPANAAYAATYSVYAVRAADAPAHAADAATYSVYAVRAACAPANAADASSEKKIECWMRQHIRKLNII